MSVDLQLWVSYAVPKTDTSGKLTCASMEHDVNEIVDLRQ